MGPHVRPRVKVGPLRSALSPGAVVGKACGWAFLGDARPGAAHAFAGGAGGAFGLGDRLAASCR
jgi:hypothetical protein